MAKCPRCEYELPTPEARCSECGSGLVSPDHLPARWRRKLPVLSSGLMLALAAAGLLQSVLRYPAGYLSPWVWTAAAAANSTSLFIYMYLPQAAERVDEDRSCPLLWQLLTLVTGLILGVEFYL
jgi:hypothetical protein